MKPDWKDAPEWANWLAQDNSGRWTWFKGYPVFDLFRWEAPFWGFGKSRVAFEPKTSIATDAVIEKRPEAK